MNVVLRLTEAAVEFVRVQPNHCVEVVLRCVVVVVVTTTYIMKRLLFI